MEVQYWTSPVDLELHGQGKYRTITGTRHAAECLLTLWPSDHGAAYRMALAECLDALEGRATSQAARRAFIAAAREADIVVRLH